MKILNENILYQSVALGSKTEKIPSKVLFELTYGCNFRCVHCYNPTHQARPEELSTKEIHRILNEIADLGVLSIIFTGGELFTRPDILEILEHAKRLGLLIDIFTNASLLTDLIVKRLDELGIRDMVVSIYGTTPSTFEKVTRQANSYERFLRGIVALAKSSLNVHIRIPLLTLNKHEAETAKLFVESMGFPFRFYLEIEPRQDGNQEPLQYNLNAGEKMDILKRLRPEALEKPPFEEKQFSTDFIECACGKEQFAVTPYGKMNFCVSFPTPNYDLRCGTVKEGWQILQKLVREAKPNENYHCPGCDVRSFCQQGRSDAWLETGDMSVCLPRFKEAATLHKTAVIHKTI